MKLKITVIQELIPGKNGQYILVGDKAKEFLNRVSILDGKIPSLPCQIKNTKGFITIEEIA